MSYLTNILLSISAKAVAFWAIATHVFLEGFVVIGGTKGYIVLAVVFGFLNTFIKPILKILTFPIHLITLGLFSFILNGILLWLTKEGVNFFEFAGVAVQIDGWIVYLVAGLILAALSTSLQWVLGKS